jgi:hypothetical protein
MTKLATRTPGHGRPLTPSTIPLLALALALMLVLVLAGCGGGSQNNTASQAASTASTASTHTTAPHTTTTAADTQTGLAPIPADAVAVVGTNPITRRLVNKWMPYLFGEDIYSIGRVPSPPGMVADPPNYPSCVAGVTFLEKKHKKHGVSLPTGTIKTTCEQLNQAIRDQATRFLITVQTSINLDAQQGIHINNTEIAQEFKTLAATRFPKEGELQNYLATRRWPLQTELYYIKRDLLTKRLEAKYNTQGGEQALSHYLQTAEHKWKTQTNCRPNYTVENCNQYKETTTPTTPPAGVLIERILGIKVGIPGDNEK